MNGDNRKSRLAARRQFLSGISAMAAGSGIVFHVGGGAAAHAKETTADAEKDSRPLPILPTIPLGKFPVTRLVAGSNPIGGYSYLGPHTDRHMKEYFTPERTVEFLLKCEREGINAHQFSLGDKSVEVLRAVRERGSKMHFICLHAGREQIKGTIESTRPIAMAHHGGVTDTLFSQGKSQEVHDYVKEAHDRGVLAGVSAHNPDCIRRIADEGWEVDFFMACFHFLTRKGGPALPTLEVGYPFFAADPAAMTQVMRQVKQPCLGFKILAAGRKCGSQESVRQAFRFAFENIKPTDGVIVGMYPRFHDEVRSNAEYAREFGRLPVRQGDASNPRDSKGRTELNWV